MYGKCVQPKSILIGQMVKLVGKWPMADRGYVYIDYSTFYHDLFFHVLYITLCITLSITTRQSEECSSTQ